MRNERVILCGDADWPVQEQGLKEPVRLQLSGGQQNIELRIQDISKDWLPIYPKFFSTFWRSPPMFIVPTKPSPGAE